MTGIPDPGGVSGTFAALERTQPALDEPMTFAFAEFIVRGWLIDGEPLFVAHDIAEALEYRMASDMTRRLDDDEKGTRPVRTPGGVQNVSIITESGLYAAILGSRSPGAIDFKRWVTRELLPALRRTGSYSTAPALTEDQIVHQALAITSRRVEALTAKVAELEPKAEFYDDLMDAEGAYSWQATANVLGWGRNVMLRQLRRAGVVQGNRLPYARYAHHFKVVPKTYTHPNTGEQILTATTYVLPSGVEFLRRKLAGSEVDA
jgi:prophage antirepressor-like protein